MDSPQCAHSQALEELLKVNTLRELTSLVGEVTPEEQEMIDSLTLHEPVTQDELETLGPDLIERILEADRRHRILAKTSEKYSQLSDNHEVWQAELAERKIWDATLSDGLEDEDDWKG